MPPADWIALVNGLMLMALTVRAFWGWVFGREHSEKNLAEQVQQNKESILEVRQRHKDLSDPLQALVISHAVLKQRVDYLEWQRKTTDGNR